MNARTYGLDTDAAKKADNKSNRITETGQYIGKFTRAEAVKSEKGTEGVEFTFLSSDGRTADYLTLWTYNHEGKELFGNQTLMAIMTCLKTKSIAPSLGTVQKFNPSAGAAGPVQVTLFQDLMNKPIGVLLQREEYAKKDGTVGNKFNIYGVFESATGFTASEILEQAKTPTKLERMAASLEDKPLNMAQARQAYSSPGGPSGKPSEFEDDIPF